MFLILRERNNIFKILTNFKHEVKRWLYNGHVRIDNISRQHLLEIAIDKCALNIRSINNCALLSIEFVERINNCVLLRIELVEFVGIFIIAFNIYWSIFFPFPLKRWINQFCSMFTRILKISRKKKEKKITLYF